MKGKQKAVEEEGIFITPEIPPLMEYLNKFIEKYGCSEMQIVVLDHDMNAEIIGTIDRTTTMLGALNQAVYRYTYEMENELDDEE